MQATAPNTITFAGSTATGIAGENLQFGAVTFATGPTGGETQVTLAKVKLYDATGDSLTANVSSALVTLVVPEHVQGNIDCLGAVGVDDVTALLAALSGVAFNHGPGCTPRARRFTVFSGEISTVTTTSTLQTCLPLCFTSPVLAARATALMWVASSPSERR